MPQWQPDWTDVQFDYQAAYESISTCHGCIAFVESRHQALGPARDRARSEWRGRHREEFETEMAFLERVALDVIDQLRSSIRSVHAEIEAAEAEQRVRVSERRRWEDEARAEHAWEEQRPSLPTPGGPTVRRDGVIVLS